MRHFSRTWADFHSELDAVSAKIKDLSQYQGRLTENPETLLEWMTLYNELLQRLGVMGVYLNMANSVDTQDEDAKSAQGQYGTVASNFAGASGFAAPEMLENIDTLLAWAESNDDLAVYKHYFDHLKRQAAHTRSGEVEELLGTLGDIFGGSRRVWGELVNNDLQYADLTDSDGNTIPYKQSRGMFSKDRDIRRQGWDSLHNAYLDYKNVLITNYINSARQNVFMAKAKGYNSVLEYRLEPTGLTVDVFHNLLNTFQEYYPMWHKYWDVKRKALKQDEMYPYDIWTSCLETPPEIDYYQAVDIIATALAPLGDDYVARLKKGCLEDGWVDWGNNLNRRGGAFSSPSYDSSPPLYFHGRLSQKFRLHEYPRA